MAMAAWGWVLIAALVVYGVAMALASLRRVPKGSVGVLRGRSGNARVLDEGLHIVLPLGGHLTIVPKGPERVTGHLPDMLTKDGWRVQASIQLDCRLMDPNAAARSDRDWRQVTLDGAMGVLRTELENNDAVDMRPRPHALDEGVRDELNILTARSGVVVDWLRVTIRWATALPPTEEPPSTVLKGPQGQEERGEG